MLQEDIIKQIEERREFYKKKIKDERKEDRDLLYKSMLNEELKEAKRNEERQIRTQQLKDFFTKVLKWEKTFRYENQTKKQVKGSVDCYTSKERTMDDNLIVRIKKEIEKKYQEDNITLARESKSLKQKERLIEIQKDNSAIYYTGKLLDRLSKDWKEKFKQRLTRVQLKQHKALNISTKLSDEQKIQEAKYEESWLREQSQLKKQMAKQEQIKNQIRQQHKRELIKSLDNSIARRKEENIQNYKDKLKEAAIIKELINKEQHRLLEEHGKKTYKANKYLAELNKQVADKIRSNSKILLTPTEISINKSYLLPK